MVGLILAVDAVRRKGILFALDDKFVISVGSRQLANWALFDAMTRTVEYTRDQNTTRDLYAPHNPRSRPSTHIFSLQSPIREARRGERGEAMRFT